MLFNLESAIGLLSSGPLLILPHDNPDPDSLAGAMGLARLAQSVGCESVIGLGGIVGRAENRAFVRELAIPLVPMASIDPRNFGRIALIDTQPGTGNNSLPPGRAADIIIDHHPPRPESLAAPWCDLREEAGVSSAIVLEYLVARGINIDTRLATAFLYAIKSETRDLGREATPPLRRTYVDLLPRADHQTLYAITHPKLPLSHFAAVDRAIRFAEVRGPLITVNLGVLAYPDLVAEVADLLLAVEGARWVLCVGCHDDMVALSIRTDIDDARAGEMIRRMIGPRGAGGGHGMSAGGRLFEPVTDGDRLCVLYRDLAQRLANELKIEDETLPLLRG